MCQKQEAKGEVPFADQHVHLRRGDIIGIVGVWPLSLKYFFMYADDVQFPGRTNPK